MVHFSVCNLECWGNIDVAHTPSLSRLPYFGDWACSVTGSVAMFIRTKLGIRNVG